MFVIKYRAEILNRKVELGCCIKMGNLLDSKLKN